MSSIIEFGRYVRKMRKSRGKNASELAKEAGISQSYLSQIENGKLEKTPSVGVVYNLSEPLGVTSSMLLFKAGYVGEAFENQKTEYPYQSEEAAKDLHFFLRRNDITYNGYKLTPSERRRLQKMLPLIFDDKKSGKYSLRVDLWDAQNKESEEGDNNNE